MIRKSAAKNLYSLIWVSALKGHRKTNTVRRELDKTNSCIKVGEQMSNQIIAETD